MSNKKVIAVIGATGAQGGGLARAILAHPDGPFALRAITRNVDSEKAKLLADAGAEVVAADLDDKDSLIAAFDGAYGAFLLTNFWEHFSAEKELAQARNMAEAAKAAGVQHVVWSTLEDTRNWVPLESDQMPTLHEKYKVPHFDAKGEADAIFAELGVPTTYLLTSFYWDNFIYFGMGPQRGEDGKLGFAMPMGDVPLPGIAAEDIGRCAYGVFLHPDLIGRRIGISGEHVTGAQMATKLSEAYGEEVVYHAVPPEVYRTFPFPGADDIGNMFQFKRDFAEDFQRPRDVDFSRQLNPQLQSFSDWVDANKSALKA